MGTVFMAEDRSRDNKLCVIKQLNNKFRDPREHQEAVRLFKREAAMLKALDHSNIVRIFDDYATDDGRYFLVMDYVAGRNLDSTLRDFGPLAAETVTLIGIQCCDVLTYLHGLDPPVIYRDLKPSNLMLTPDGQVIFIDFGIARVFMPKDNATRVVSVGYSAPEQYFGKPEFRSDLYSLGATMHHLLTGAKPKPLTLCNPRALKNSVPLLLDDIIRRLTAHHVEQRPESAIQVREELLEVYAEFHPELKPTLSSSKIDTHIKFDESAGPQSIELARLVRRRLDSSPMAQSESVQSYQLGKKQDLTSLIKDKLHNVRKRIKSIFAKIIGG
jgi:serine/threonine-protein kinase